MSIEEAYNSWANQYDTNLNKTRDLDQKATINTLENYKFSKVIELGCGTGKNTVYLLKRAIEIVALDFSEEMLKIAKKKVNTDKVEFYKTNLMEDWTVTDNFADLISCNLTLEHIHNLDFIFAQAYKKLIKNGYFFICELHPFKQYLGSKARYKDGSGTVDLEVFTHHISEYIENATKNGFKLVELKEWFDREEENEIPRLISFVFKKN